jgi:hypothetical protein
MKYIYYLDYTFFDETTKISTLNSHLDIDEKISFSHNELYTIKKIIKNNEDDIVLIFLEYSDEQK